MMLMHLSKIVIDAFLDAPPDKGPLIDVEKACEEGSKIRFFENAFEWQNMTYVFYPYFWA